MSPVREVQGPREERGLLGGGLRRKPVSGPPECEGRRLWLTGSVLALVNGFRGAGNGTRRVSGEGRG